MESPKTQWIRLADMVAIGPLMIYSSLHMRKDKEWAAIILRALGLSTILYNAKNYQTIERASAQKLNTPPDLP